MAYYSDLVKDKTTTVGVGDIVLSNATAQGFVSFAAAFEIGQLVQYAVRSPSGLEWEDGLAPLLDSNTIGRTSPLAKVLSSSNGGGLVNFSSGEKDVFNSLSAYHANSFRSRGQVYARHLIM